MTIKTIHTRNRGRNRALKEQFISFCGVSPQEDDEGQCWIHPEEQSTQGCVLNDPGQDGNQSPEDILFFLMLKLYQSRRHGSLYF